MAKKNKPNELYITRIYDAPVKLVWDAWTDPKQTAKWWGPRGFTITTHSKDLRVGGHWTYTMHGPDGVNYENKTIYFEVEKHARLVYDHGGNDDRPPLFRVTVNFTDIKGKTKMEMTMAFPSEEVAKASKKFIRQANGNSTWDRLAEYLEREDTGKDIFVIQHAFEAPLETVYDMWSNPKHLQKWLPPQGLDMKVLKGDIKMGESLFFSMSNGSDFTLYGRMEYIKLEKPNTLTYTQQFCDKDGKVSRHPGAPTWPETLLTTVTFTAEENGTRVRVQSEAYGSTTTEELTAFIKERTGMTQGWNGSFDKLEELLLSK